MTYRPICKHNVLVVLYKQFSIGQKKRKEEDQKNEISFEGTFIAIASDPLFKEGMQQLKITVFMRNKH